MAGWWLGKSQGTVRVQVDRSAERRLQAQLVERERRIQALQKENAKLRQQLRKPKDDLGELTFYHELPKQSVTPAPMGPEVARQPRIKRDSTKKEDHVSRVIERELAGKTGGFRIQISSFRRRTDAETLLRKLRRQHVTASIRAVEVAGKGRWYRVIAGPYHSRLLAEHARKTIERKLKLHGLVVYGSER
ncbi:MAG: SPOR domain-containing protein [Zetaproteobacteria bacterium]|nr:MAG: SPOR domain-containing protein [Zetaproteobacteria bacterium]